MRCYQKILLIADSSHTITPAYDQAVRLARISGAELHLCLFEYNSSIEMAGLVSPSVRNWAHKAYVDECSSWLLDVALDAREHRLKVYTDVIWQRPIHEAILSKALAVSADLVIKDAGVKQPLLTPLDWELLRACPCPLLLTRHLSGDVCRIAVAIDLGQLGPAQSELNEQILERAKQLADHYRGELHLIHAFEGLPPIVMASADQIPSDIDQSYELLFQGRKEQFNALAERHSIPQPRRHLLRGLAADVIESELRRIEASFLVLGTNQRSGLSRLMLGSTAERLLPHLHCSMLAVRHDTGVVVSPPRT